jgi:hypothetical protein
MSDNLERRVRLLLFPSNPRFSGEVVEIPVEYGVKLPIRAKNLRLRGEVIFTPQGQVIFDHAVAKVRPAPDSSERFEFVESDGIDEEQSGGGRREFRVQPGGVAGVWPRETQTDRFLHEGRRFLRLEVASLLTDE